MRPVRSHSLAAPNTARVLGSSPNTARDRTCRTTRSYAGLSHQMASSATHARWNHHPATIAAAISGMANSRCGR